MNLKNQKGLLCKTIGILKVMDISIFPDCLNSTGRQLYSKEKQFINMCLSFFNHSVLIYIKPKNFWYVFFTPPPIYYKTLSMASSVLRAHLWGMLFLVKVQALGTCNFKDCHQISLLTLK